MSPPGLFHRDLSQGYALTGGLDKGQATHLGRERIDLVSALANHAEQTLNGMRSSDVAMHRLRKLVKHRGVLIDSICI